MSNQTSIKKGNPVALLPIGIFLVLYLGFGILFEYVLKIEMGFYNIPIVVVFMIALFVACLQNKEKNFEEKIDIMASGVGDRNIIIMILIFIEAGMFVGIVGRGSAQSVAYFMLSLIPAQYAVGVLFIVAALVSISMGTSVGTITLITPIGLALAQASGFSVPLTVATVIGGAMFGDNLSFISDTTIAACNGQGCAMKDKFRENFAIALPAALVSLILVIVFTMRSDAVPFEIPEYSLIIIVLVGGIVGINVFLVLTMGIVSGALIMLVTGAIGATEILGNMGSGVNGMFETAMVAILVSAICALIRENGGFVALLDGLYKVFRGNKGGLLGMGVLVVLLDIATANNTVAIVMANPIAKEMSGTYGITPSKAASILDTFSCIAQGIIPYGAQMLVALAAAAAFDINLSAFQVIPFLFYPFMLCISSLIFIFLIKEK